MIFLSQNPDISDKLQEETGNALLKNVDDCFMCMKFTIFVWGEKPKKESEYNQNKYRVMCEKAMVLKDLYTFTSQEQWVLVYWINELYCKL